MNEENQVRKLLTQLKNKKSEAILVLYPRYSTKFYCYARDKGLTHEDAEDAVGTIFQKILTHIHSFDENLCTGEQWLWTICNNQVIDIIRRKNHQPLRLLESYPSPEDTNPEIYFEKRELDNALARAFERLSELDRMELIRGRGRGPGRRAWHAVIQRLRTNFWEEYRA